MARHACEVPGIVEIVVSFMQMNGTLKPFQTLQVSDQVLARMLHDREQMETASHG
jgi:hypothetical protein